MMPVVMVIKTRMKRSRLYCQQINVMSTISGQYHSNTLKPALVTTAVEDRFQDFGSCVEMYL